MLGEKLGCFVRDFSETSLSNTLTVILSHTDTLKKLLPTFCAEQTIIVTDAYVREPQLE